MKNLKTTQKEYLTLSPLLESMNREILIFRQDWKKFEQDNKKTALNILFVPYNTKQIRQAYKS